MLAPRTNGYNPFQPSRRYDVCTGPAFAAGRWLWLFTSILIWHVTTLRTAFVAPPSTRSPAPAITIAACSAGGIGAVFPMAILSSFLAAVAVLSAASLTREKTSTSPVCAAVQWYTAFDLPTSCAVRAAVAQCWWFLVPFFFNDFIDDYGISVNTPSATLEDCYKSRGCHTYRTDRFGFRGADRVPTGRDSRRIAFVGDSFVLGSGVADGATLPDHLEMLLNAETNMKITVFNAGKSGTSLVSFPGMVRYVRDKVKPALVV